MDSMTIWPGLDVLIRKEKLNLDEVYELEPDLSESKLLLDQVYHSRVVQNVRPYVTSKLAEFLEDHSEELFVYAMVLENKNEGRAVEVTILPHSQSTWLKIDKDFGPVIDREAIDGDCFQVHIWRDGYSTFSNQNGIYCYEQHGFLDDSGIVLIGEKSKDGFDRLLEELKECMK